MNEFAVGSVPGSGKLFRIEYRDYFHFRSIARMMQIMDDEKVRRKCPPPPWTNSR